MTTPTLLLTTTGEPYQPVRLNWTVPGRAYAQNRLETLDCVGLDAETKALCLWHLAEANELQLGTGFGFPTSESPARNGRQVILGTFRFPAAGSLTLEVRSFTRAIALAQMLKPVLGPKAMLTRARVVNRWFEAREAVDGLPALDRCLDRDVTVIRWEETADELDAFVARGRTPEERQALHTEWSESRRHRDIPLVEDFPCHPEEEDERLSNLAFGLNLRLARAHRHWIGQPVTLRQIIEETVARMPPQSEFEAAGTRRPGR
ncbi:MAG: hypothetical protein RL199_1596 [Pseudomonadota bacterium]|jgi:hypothetical protein